MTPLITLTDAAIEAVKKRLVKRATPDARVRVGVKGSGCNGFSYVIQYEDAPPRQKDVEYSFSGVSVVIDNKSLTILAGTVIDYEKTFVSEGFSFKNPNAKKTCGCGESFET